MRHFVRARAFAAPAPVAPLALGMTVPAAPRVLIPASRPAQRFTPSEAAAACPAVLLASVAARADEHLAPASGTQKQSGIVHCSPRRGGLDDPRLPGNTAFGAVRKCGSGRSLGRDPQVSAVRGCVGLLADSDLTPTHERRHRRYARRARPLAGSIGSGGKSRHVPSGRGGPIQRWFASTGTVSSRGLFAIYPRIFTATNIQVVHGLEGVIDAPQQRSSVVECHNQVLRIRADARHQVADTILVADPQIEHGNPCALTCVATGGAFELLLGFDAGCAHRDVRKA